MTTRAGHGDADVLRAEMLERWERAAPGWSRRADRVRETSMPVSARMIDQLALQPGQQVLELAAGPGDTGFLAAELIKPGGTLICSDAAEGMLQIARERAAAMGVDNAEFKALQLEWIDLPTASVDAVLCRWGLMLSVDPAAGGRECRRVLRPGGRIAVAVWDDPALNPWATIPSRALIELGHAERPDPDAPGMFALAAPGRLAELLGDAGFMEVVVESVEIDRSTSSPEEYLAETYDLSRPVAELLDRLSEGQRAELTERITTLAEPYTLADGSLRLPGRSLVAGASA